MAYKIPKNGCVIRQFVTGSSAVIELDDEHGERVIREYVLDGWSWAPAAERARAEEVLRRPPIAIYGRHPKDPRRRQ